jgi:hypothetical protein
MTLYVDKQPSSNGDLKRLKDEILKLLDQKVCLSCYDNPNTQGFTISIEHCSPQGDIDTTVIRYDNDKYVEGVF